MKMQTFFLLFLINVFCIFIKKPKMVEVTMYACSDGSLFKTKKEAEERDALIEKINKIFSNLTFVNPESNIAVKQNKDDVLYAMDKFMELCKELFPGKASEEIFEKYKLSYRNNDNSVHKSHLQRIFSDYGIKAINNAFYRFDCINRKTFIEYPNSLYSNNPQLFSGTIV